MPRAGALYHAARCAKPDRSETDPLSSLIKRSFSLSGHRTSVALEAEFWDVLRDAAQYRRTSLAALVAAVDAEREVTRPLASALRLCALREARLAGNPGAGRQSTH